MRGDLIRGQNFTHVHNIGNHRVYCTELARTRESNVVSGFLDLWNLLRLGKLCHDPLLPPKIFSTNFCDSEKWSFPALKSQKIRHMPENFHPCIMHIYKAKHR